MFSPSIGALISAFKKLPSVGERTAERFVVHLLKSGKKETTELMMALQDLIANIKSCKICWNFSDTSPCAICKNKKRDQTLIAVVADPQDILVLERTGAYNGLYHILRGTIDSTDPHNLMYLKIKELLQRAKPRQTGITEIILAFNPDIAGETTMLYLEKEIKKVNPNVMVSRLARGLPMGSDLKYADEITLTGAIKNRTTRI